MRHGSLLSSVPLFLFLLFFASPEEDYRAGVSLFEQGRLAEAAERLRAAFAAAPNNAQYAKALGVSLAAQKRYAEADEPFARACTIDPKLTDACYFYGRNLYALDRFEASIAALEKARPVDPRPWRIWLGIAQAEHGLGRSAEAMSSYQKAIALYRGGAPPSEDPRVYFGLFLFREGRLAEAEKVLAALCRERPDSARGHLELGRVLLQTGRPGEAVTELQSAVKLGAGEQAELLLRRAQARVPR